MSLPSLGLTNDEPPAVDNDFVDIVLSIKPEEDVEHCSGGLTISDQSAEITSNPVVPCTLGPEQFMCHICDQEFEFKDLLEKHFPVHDTNMPQTDIQDLSSDKSNNVHIEDECHENQNDVQIQSPNKSLRDQNEVEDRNPNNSLTNQNEIEYQSSSKSLTDTDEAQDWIMAMEQKARRKRSSDAKEEIKASTSAKKLQEKSLSSTGVNSALENNSPQQQTQKSGYACFKCEKKIGQYSNLLYHYATKHFQSHFEALYNTDNWNCSLCLEQVKSEQLLIWHLVKKHNCLESMIPPQNSQELSFTDEEAEKKEESKDHSQLKERTGKFLPDEMESLKVQEIQRNWYQCNLCKRVTDRYSSLRIHLGTVHYKETLKQHYGEKEWECKHCNRSYVNERQLLCHLSCLHNGTYLLDLNKSDFEIDINQARAKHSLFSRKLAKGLSGELFKCPICNAIRKKYSSLRVHIGSAHHRNKLASMYGNKMWNCGLCPKESTTEGNLISHLVSSHKAISELMPKKESARVTKQVSSQDLMKNKRSKGLKKVPQLGRGLSKKSAEHLSGKKPCPTLATKKRKKVFRCEICNAKRSSIRNAQRHMALVHFKNELKKMYVKNETDCRVCSKCFADDSQLLEHIANVHNGLQDFLPLKK